MDRKTRQKILTDILHGTEETEDLEEWLTDIVTNILLYADSNKITYYKITRNAVKHFLMESLKEC